MCPKFTPAAHVYICGFLETEMHQLCLACWWSACLNRAGSVLFVRGLTTVGMTQKSYPQVIPTLTPRTPLQWSPPLSPPCLYSSVMGKHR